MADKTINLAIDAMGGDNAPFEIIKGAVLSVQNNNKINILLVGDEIQIKNSLSQLGPEALESIETNRITIIPSEGVIKDGDQPVIALKKNPKASIVISAYLVKNGQADGLISMGSTGASMAACALTMGIIKGIERPTVGGPIIGNSPNTVVLDIGANVGLFSIFASPIAKKIYAIEPTPSHFALMKELISTTGITNIDPYQLGVHTENGSIDFNIHDMNSTMNSFITHKTFPHSGRTIKVKTKTLSSLIDHLKCESIDFVKMDIEGYEVDLICHPSFEHVKDKIKRLI